MDLNDITNIAGKFLGGNKDQTKADAVKFKEGYAAAEKKYKMVFAEKNIAIAQLHKLGYELGEAPSPLKSAHSLKQGCRTRTNCNGCDFAKNGKCVLHGENPSDWEIM